MALQIGFGDVSDARANVLASSLLEALRDIDPGVDAQQVRPREDSQDLGTAIALVLGTAAAQAVARGIGTWIARHSGVKVEFMHDGKTVLVATDVDSKDVSKILEAIRAQPPA